VGFGYIDEGPLVFALQYLLQAEGHYVAADGVFGPQTDSMVRSFQEAAEVPVDGLVGSITWPALIQGHTLPTSSTGPDVRAAQHLLLHKHGYADVIVDGVFGRSTASAVKDLQAKYGLPVDGIVGPVTWKALVAG